MLSRCSKRKHYLLKQHLFSKNKTELKTDRCCTAKSNYKKSTKNTTNLLNTADRKQLLKIIFGRQQNNVNHHEIVLSRLICRK